MRIEKTIVQSKYLEMELKKLQRIESIKSGSIIPSSSKIAPFEPLFRRGSSASNEN